MMDYIRIGERIRKARKKKKMTQAQLAEAVELSTIYICELENNKKQAGLNALMRISEALNITMDELLYGDQKEDREESLASMVLNDCSDFERQVICKNMSELKKILREHRKGGAYV